MKQRAIYSNFKKKAKVFSERQLTYCGYSCVLISIIADTNQPVFRFKPPLLAIPLLSEAVVMAFPTAFQTESYTMPEDNVNS